MENKKYYTFLSANRCIGTNDNEYIGVTAEITVAKLTDKVVNGVNLVSGRAAITNRAKTLENVLGHEVTPDENGNVWIDVTFWDDRADRFKKYLNGREKVRLIVVGVLTYNEFTRGDGTKGASIGIKVSDWKGTEVRKAE